MSVKRSGWKGEGSGSGLLLFPSNDSHEDAASTADDGSDDISLADMNSGGNAQNASVTPKPWWRHQRRILFVCLCIVVNVLDIVWITYYIRAATDPNPRTPVNRSHAGWQAYYLIMYVFGFFWGCVKIVVWMAYFQPSQSSPAITRSKGVLRHCWHCVRLPTLLPIAIMMGLGPFFAPFVGVKLAQEHAWLHRCDTFAVKYNLTNDWATSIWQFALSAAQSLVEVTYNISNFTLQATCPSNTSQCTQGSFQESGFLSFSLTDSFNSAVKNLRAVDKDWVYGHSDDAPSFLLKEVLPDGSLGNVVVRTAMTQPGHCANLKLCASDASGETLVPIGLTLIKQNKYSRSFKIHAIEQIITVAVALALFWA
ncbi:hypothetical protein B0H19DRAFT_1069532 [Mycena capillaripes]|nr:hypothetical protein B0H19DRAFT_1069532 [Mycena capillaripes]